MRKRVGGEESRGVVGGGGAEETNSDKAITVDLCPGLGGGSWEGKGEGVARFT